MPMLFWLPVIFSIAMAGGLIFAAETHPGAAEPSFPPPLASYGDSGMTSVWAILRGRVAQQPFNLYATLLFLGGWNGPLLPAPTIIEADWQGPLSLPPNSELVTQGMPLRSAAAG